MPLSLSKNGKDAPAWRETGREGLQRRLLKSAADEGGRMQVKEGKIFICDTRGTLAELLDEYVP